MVIRARCDAQLQLLLQFQQLFHLVATIAVAQVVSELWFPNFLNSMTKSFVAITSTIFHVDH